ncbi:MAG: hypothetical protein ABS98_07290 [Lysobacteraceae bacterium SCN 69-48]|nr:MAG: hypothetical protein ABS98_07290 [Xanthomonadaceae bacterium SCN 69-48]
MTRAERLELALIPLAAAAAWGVAARLPDAPGLGDLLLAGAVLLLLQGLLRDLWLLWRRRALAAAAQPRRMPCLCLESALGTTGVLAGLVFLGSGLAWRMAMPDWGWSLLVAVVLALGFAIKDLVIALRPLRLVRDADHLNIAVGWR